MLTVVVPSYNGERFLTKTLDSLHRQETRVAVVVVDDGSTDRSAEIAERHPAVTALVRQGNRGVAVARNVGLATAETEWVAFCDQDDLWHPARATDLLNLADSTGCEVVGTTETTFALVDNRSEDRSALVQHWLTEEQLDDLLAAEPTGAGDVEWVTLDALLRSPQFITTALAYRRTVAISAGGFPINARSIDDHVFNVNLASLVGDIPRVRRETLFYRVHPDAESNRTPLPPRFLTALLAARFGGVVPPEPVCSSFIDEMVAGLPASALSRTEQVALMMLTVPSASRPRWVARWAKRQVRTLRQSAG